MFQPCDIVLAKVKGYPAWPAMIIPIEIIPPNILKKNSHFVEQETDDNDEFISYSDILKFKKFTQVQESYCVKFFKDDSYIWVKASDLSKLTLQDCENWIVDQSSRHKRLIPAYEMACDGFKDGIDVWEFVEYGSLKKRLKKSNEDIDYMEDDKKTKSPVNKHNVRTSTRQRSTRRVNYSDLEPIDNEVDSRNNNDVSKDSEDKEFSLPTPTTKRKRNLRNKKEPIKESIKDINENEIKEAKDEIFEELPMTKATKKRKKKVDPAPKYTYDDDENWTIVGLGPQDASIMAHVSPLANKLTQKKNIEIHNEQRLEIIDRLSAINKSMCRIFTTTGINKDDYEMLLDEFDNCFNLKGANDEYITLFKLNNELQINFRILFNLKDNDLVKWELLNSFQDYFYMIFKFNLQKDPHDWSVDLEFRESDQNTQGTEVDDEIIDNEQSNSIPEQSKEEIKKEVV